MLCISKRSTSRLLWTRKVRYPTRGVNAVGMNTPNQRTRWRHVSSLLVRAITDLVAAPGLAINLSLRFGRPLYTRHSSLPLEPTPNTIVNPFSHVRGSNCRFLHRRSTFWLAPIRGDTFVAVALVAVKRSTPCEQRAGQNLSCGMIWRCKASQDVSSDSINLAC